MRSCPERAWTSAAFFVWNCWPAMMSNLDLVLCAPLLELALQLLVGVGHEAGEREEGELAGLGDGGRAAGREDTGQPGGAARGRAEEATSAHTT